MIMKPNYTVSVFVIEQPQRPSGYMELTRRIQTGIYRGGFLTSFFRETFDDEDIRQQHLLQTQIRSVPTKVLTHFHDTNLGSGYNWEYEFVIGGALT